MKGFKLLFALCLALPGIGGAWGAESDDAVRAATRRGATNTVTSSRQKSNTPTAAQNTGSIARITNVNDTSGTNARERAVSSRGISNVSRSVVVPSDKSVSSRTATNGVSRPSVATRASTTGSGGRSSVAGRVARTATTASATRSGNTSTGTTRRASVSRGAIISDTVQSMRDAIMNSNATECRNVYYQCMDEFCANKDSQLKRCACSSRLHEFDSVKKQLETVEDKMLDFSQRLLTVSMDAEDAAALNIATEGELAFNKKDTSQSKKILDEITKKLNTKFDDESFDRNLTAISLSLNEDAAFDNVDSLMGASTTLKTGTALYSAALPVCRQMASEVCTPDQLSIAESGYQMMIEQDCNTVKKSYQTQTDTARAKVLENSALLDMSRLSTHQDRNSDDILTCKRKMLDMLSDTSICGDDLTKCLDMTGQYIDPLTGQAFLTTNLANLSQLITRPGANETWSGVPGNEPFVRHLNSKKKFLEPAMAHCENIADSVWDGFVEDALAQIKLAQDAKLETVRQSCTTLTAQCLSDATKTLADFDARALSTFGVIADKTVGAMCADVKNACSALMKGTTSDRDDSWTGGITEIADDQTYDTIIKTCREVGRNCIIQACKSTSGNFGLCEDIENSVNRQSIINGTACWQEVLDCVATADSNAIDRIMENLLDREIVNSWKFHRQVWSGTYNENSLITPLYSFYNNLYFKRGTSTYWPSSVSNSSTCISKDKNCVYDLCVGKGECKPINASDVEQNINTRCKRCRIAERIWGNCEVEPHTPLTLKQDPNNTIIPHNKIKKTINGDDTLLYWFALNTGTEDANNSCVDTSCGPGYRKYTNTDLGIEDMCVSEDKFTIDGKFCMSTSTGEDSETGEAAEPTTDATLDALTPFSVAAGQANCCTEGILDAWGNCCSNSVTVSYDAGDSNIYGSVVNTIENAKVCVPNENAEYVLTFAVDHTADTAKYYTGDQYALICIGTLNTDGENIECVGTYLIVDINNGRYYYPDYDEPIPGFNMSYIIDNGKLKCQYEYTENNDNTYSWKWVAYTRTNINTENWSLAPTRNTECKSVFNATNTDGDPSYQYNISF